MVRSLQDSPDGVTAINEDGSASDKIGSSGRQKDSGAGKFVGTTPAASRCPCNDFLVQGHRFDVRRHVSFNPSRDDCVHLNIERCQFDCHRLGRKLRKQEAGVEVRLDHLIPIPWSQIEDASDDGYTRVVNQNAYGPSRLFNLFQGRLQFPTRGNIDFHRQARNSILP
jgi:hypothetical protein